MFFLTALTFMSADRNKASSEQSGQVSEFLYSKQIPNELSHVHAVNLETKPKGIFF